MGGVGRKGHEKDWREDRKEDNHVIIFQLG